MVSIESAFVTENSSVYDFFQQPGLGFYIPLYQREYSWDAANIEQLLEDISKGIERLAEGQEDAENEIRFLGTIITVNENDKNKIQPQDTQALPTRIDKLIDGQQRLTTIAMFATLLYKQISLVQKKIRREEALKAEIDELCDNWKERLIVIFSLDLGRGNPRRKPKIIRGQRDRWTKEGRIEDNYTSPVAHYLSSFIYAIYNDVPYPIADKEKLGQKFVQNIRSIERWLGVVTSAHVEITDDFLPAWEILRALNEEYIWLFPRENFKTLIQHRHRTDKRAVDYILCELVQLFAVCHYLIERCCFTIIQPNNEDWAFDMFQSLNATGTPLTAIETFKPLVVNITEVNEVSFKNSENEKHFTKVEDLFTKAKDAAQKSKLTNDFLTSFAITIDGSKLSSHFSHQRKWLDKYFNELQPYAEKAHFIKFFGDYADYYKLWNEYNGSNNHSIPLISDADEAELASLLQLFLKESNHKMAITVLGYFFKDVINGTPDSIPNFIGATKTIAAFYCLWRSAGPNAGLDNVYRDFFKGVEQSWRNRKVISLSQLKAHFQAALTKLGLNDYTTWSAKALVELKYNRAISVCRFALFVSAHDTIPDPKHLGLMKIGTNQSAPFLTLSKWTSPNLKHIEHVAPVKNNNDWDENLYSIEKELFQSVGNLTLLPADVNISVSNRGWPAKFLYYCHLSENDPTKVRELANKAINLDIELSAETIELLRASNYSGQIAPIVTLTENGSWNSDFVEVRAKRIIEILWSRVNSWLF